MSYAHEALVLFPRAFTLSGVGHELGAGTYRIVTYGDEILGVTFLAHRETVYIHTPAVERDGARHQVFQVDSAEIAKVLAA
jgi:hypothetical protein